MTIPGLVGNDNYSGGTAFTDRCAYTFTVPVDTYVTHMDVTPAGGGGNLDVGITLGLPSDVAAISWLDKVSLTAPTGGVHQQVALPGGPLLLTAGVTYAIVCAKNGGGTANITANNGTGLHGSNATIVSAGTYYNLSGTGGWSGPLGTYAPSAAAYADGSGAPVLALVATDEGDGTVTLDVTDAAHPGTVKYTADFSAGVDSWTAGTDGAGGTPTLLAPKVDPSGRTGLQLGTSAGTKLLDTDQYVRRTVTGLTSGHIYRVECDAQSDPSSIAYSSMRIGKTGDLSPAVAVSEFATTHLSYDVTATGTSLAVEVRLGVDTTNSNYPILSNVTVTDLGTAALEPLQIQRTDDNGTHYVRLPEDATPDGTGALTVVDAEAALTGLVTYTVRDGEGNTATDSVSLAVATPLIGTTGYLDVLDVDRVDGYTGSRRYAVASTDALPIIGRGDPIVTERGDATWSKRQGTLTFAPQPSYAEAQAIVDVHTQGRVVLLRQPTHPGLDLYYVADVITGPTPVYLKDTWRWQVEVEYVEVGWPDGDLAGTPGWTWADLVASELAWWNVTATYSTWADAKVGP